MGPRGKVSEMDFEQTLWATARWLKARAYFDASEPGRASVCAAESSSPASPANIDTGTLALSRTRLRDWVTSADRSSSFNPFLGGCPPTGSRETGAKHLKSV